MNSEITYCSDCGGRLVEKHIEGRTRQYCRDCDCIRYRNPKPCAGTLVVDGTSVLLVKRTEPPSVGKWSLPAGYLEYDEPPETAAVRELAEETNLRTQTEALELLNTSFVQHPAGHHVLVLIYVTSAEETKGTLKAGDDAGDARFWTAAELRNNGEQIEPGYMDIFEEALALTTMSEQP